MGEENIMKRELEGREIAVEIEKIIHAVDSNFWVPAIGNGQLGELMKFIEKNNLWDAVKATVVVK